MAAGCARAAPRSPGPPAARTRPVGRARPGHPDRVDRLHPPRRPRRLVRVVTDVEPAHARSPAPLLRDVGQSAEVPTPPTGHDRPTSVSCPRTGVCAHPGTSDVAISSVSPVQETPAHGPMFTKSIVIGGPPAAGPALPGAADAGS